MSTSLAEKFGINIEPSQLTQTQKERLNSHDYYFEAAKAISLGIDALIRVDRSKVGWAEERSPTIETIPDIET